MTEPSVLTGPSRYWLCPDQLFDGETLLSDAALLVEDGQSVRITPRAKLSPQDRQEPVAGTLAPGFIDLQVNGGGGALLNYQPTPGGIRTILAAHRRFGTMALLPTVITDRPEVLDAAAAAVMALWPTPGVLGLHIEVPHIVLARKGTHCADFIRPLDSRTMDVVGRLRAAGVPVLITLAPEAVAPGQIASLVRIGAVVSLGHTDATSDQMKAALAEGARSVTHLHNAMPPMLNRAPGAVGAAINSDAYLGFICDGHHVHDDMLALSIRARPVADHMFLVSDAMPTVGGPDRFELYGQEIRLSEGRLINAEGSLAGAHVTMAEGVHRLINVIGISPAEALRMAITVPARLIGADALASPVGRSLSDLLVLDGTYAMTGRLADTVPHA